MWNKIKPSKQIFKYLQSNCYICFNDIIPHTSCTSGKPIFLFFTQTNVPAQLKKDQEELLQSMHWQKAVPSGIQKCILDCMYTNILDTLQNIYPLIYMCQHGLYGIFSAGLFLSDILSSLPAAIE